MPADKAWFALLSNILVGPETQPASKPTSASIMMFRIAFSIVFSIVFRIVFISSLWILND
jgi:hypothetical protein